MGIESNQRLVTLWTRIMSKAKFLAAKELIEEGRYTEARQILVLINHPTAREWIDKIDHLAPPNISWPQAQQNTNRVHGRNTSPLNPPTARHNNRGSEAERYFGAENRKRRNRLIDKGVNLVIAGIFLLGFAAYLMITAPSTGVGDQTFPSLQTILIVFGITGLVSGLGMLGKRNQ